MSPGSKSPLENENRVNKVHESTSRRTSERLTRSISRKTDTARSNSDKKSSSEHDKRQSSSRNRHEKEPEKKRESVKRTHSPDNSNSGSSRAKSQRRCEVTHKNNTSDVMKARDHGQKTQSKNEGKERSSSRTDRGHDKDRSSRYTSSSQRRCEVTHKDDKSSAMKPRDHDQKTQSKNEDKERSSSRTDRGHDKNSSSKYTSSSQRRCEVTHKNDESNAMKARDHSQKTQSKNEGKERSSSRTNRGHNKDSSSKYTSSSNSTHHRSSHAKSQGHCEATHKNDKSNAMKKTKQLPSSGTNCGDTEGCCSSSVQSHPSNPPTIKFARKVTTLEQFMPAFVTRKILVSLLSSPSFNSTVIGCYVRFPQSSANGKQWKNGVWKIVDVEETRNTYEVDGTSTNKCIKCQWEREEKLFRLMLMPHSLITLNEFEEWMRNSRSGDMPTLSYVTTKKVDLLTSLSDKQEYLNNLDRAKKMELAARKAHAPIKIYTKNKTVEKETTRTNYGRSSGGNRIGSQNVTDAMQTMKEKAAAMSRNLAAIPRGYPELYKKLNP